jgi:Flp pilus assembly protein TadG
MKREKNPKGQGLLEFALVLPVLILIAMGALDLGRAFFSVIVINNASREGARYFTRYPDDRYTSSGVQYAGTIEAALFEASNSGIQIDSTNIDVDISNCSGDFTSDDWCRGDSIIVTVDYEFNLILGWFLPSPVTFRRSTEMMVP